MPTYDYQCGECGHEFSELHKIDDRLVPETEPCAECGKQHVKMRIRCPLISYSTAPGLKTSDNFNDRLQEIAKTKGNGHTINTRRSNT